MAVLELRAGGDLSVPRRLLIVESDAPYRDLLQRIAQPHAEVEALSDFSTAYSRLSGEPPDLLITNLRLHARLDGLQLAYVAATTGRPTRTIAYGEPAGPWVARELQGVGAFYESQLRFQFALPAYLQARLPVLDRREPMRFDRRTRYRGGRRASDVPLISVWGGT